MDETTRRIYQVFATRPLEPDEHDLYVDLDDVRGKDNVTRRLADKIRLSAGPTCQVLAGHRGSGKSTELRKLKVDLERDLAGQDRFFVVVCQADEDVDRNDVDFPEVLIALVRQLASQLKDHLQISLKPSYFKDRLNRLKNLLTSEVSLEKLDLGVGLAQLSLALKSSPDARAKIRELLEPDTSNWLIAANDIIGQAILELRKKGYAGLVILVDDLDKMIHRPHDKAGCPTTDYLFVHRSAQLTGFKCHVVYTMPLSLAFSHQEQTIKNLYGGFVPVIPMTKIAARPPGRRPHPPGVEKFREIVAARLKKVGATTGALFKSSEVQDELIRLTGGQPSALMMLVREAIITHGLPVDAASLDRARLEGRREYARLLREEHLPVLREIARTGILKRNVANEPIFRELLESRAVLQYINDEEWYGLNPLLADLVKAPPARKKRRPSK